MQPFDILSHKQSVFGSHFLEASAGTGKTFAIEHFVVRLLLESHPPIALSQILVVTFTKAATRELKSRIRHNIASAISQLKSGSAQWDYLKVIPQDLQALSIRRLEDALACFDTASIFTIHGFCFRSLNEFAFEACAALNLQDPDETQHLAIIDRTVHNFLLHKVDPSDFSPGQITQVLRHVQQKPQVLKRKLASLAAQDKEIASSLSFNQSLQSFCSQIEQLPPIDQNALMADWELLKPMYKMMQNSRFVPQMRLLSRLLEKRRCEACEFDELIREKELFLHKMDSQNLKIRAKRPDPSALNYPSLLENLHSQLLPIIDQAKNPVAIVHRLARKCQEEVKTFDITTPDDLLKQIHKNLHVEHFVQKIRSRYQAAIIDEFQDTDPMQWDIFKTLFVGHCRSICLVGDPKQSIYAFRNADLYTYLKAKEALGEDSHKCLDTNYRSTPELVKALNHLFASEKNKGWMNLPGLGLNIDVLPVKAGKPQSAMPVVPSIQFFYSESARSKRGKWPSETVEQKAFFPYIVSQMQSLKADKPWSQFAILVKDRFQALRAASFLKQVQIPAVIRRSAALNESEAFTALNELIEAVSFPSDLSRLKQFLGGSLIGWSHEQLMNGLEAETFQKVKEIIFSLHSILEEKGFACFFQSFLTTQFKEGITVEQQLLAYGQIDLYLDLQQLSEVMIESAWESKRVAQSWTAYLEELKACSLEENPRLKRRSLSDEDAVQILTIHMSKGLEFDVVFALGVASSHSLQDDIAIQDELGKRIVPLELSNPSCCNSLKELNAEKMRQLYVALTRAKKQLHIPLAFDLKNTAVDTSEISAIELYFSSVGVTPFDKAHVEQFIDAIKEEAFISLIQAASSEVQEEKTLSFAKLDKHPVLLHPKPKEPIVSYSSLAKKQENELSINLNFEPHKSETQTAQADQPLSLLNMPQGTQTGLIFHTIMEKIFQQQLHFFPQQKPILELIDRHIAHTALKDWKEILFETIWDLLHMPLQGFALSQIPSSQIQEEMQFLFPFQSGMMKGFVDLVFEWKNKYYLLDWKTNFLGPNIEDYSQENLHKCMQQNDYFLQASIYAEALERYVKLFDKRSFNQCYGGMFYVFVRAKAIVKV